MSSSRNKTIQLDPADLEKYLGRCLTPDDVSGKAACDGIIHGDCFEVMSRLPGQLASLMIADPPYNLRKAYSGSVFNKMSTEEYRIFTARWLDSALPLLLPDASVYVCCDWESSIIIGEELSKRMKVRNRITWQREKGRGAAKNWKNSMEDIWFATLSDNYTFNLKDVKLRRRVIAPYHGADGSPKDWSETADGRFRDTCPSNFWDDITVPYWSMSENTVHPAQKPEKLFARLILASTNKGDTVFDPFAGSGTSAVTAKKLGRHFVSVEASEEYCAIAQLRLERSAKDSSIQGFSDGVFWDRNAHPVVTKSKGKK